MENTQILETEYEFTAAFSGMSETAAEVGEIISPEDFYSPVLGNCFRFLMEKFHKNGKFIPEDMLDLRYAFLCRGTLPRCFQWK